MQHECKQEGTIEKLFEKLEEIQKAVSETNKQVALTNQLLVGIPDAPGLIAKVANLEKDVKELQALKSNITTSGNVIRFIGTILWTITCIVATYIFKN